ncbi:hypothetical protein STVA_41270 [Allostella vacuolata]|nr:hypothetical protein STVA_41270 [Stella vacuolata]
MTRIHYSTTRHGSGYAIPREDEHPADAAARSIARRHGWSVAAVLAEGRGTEQRGQYTATFVRGGHRPGEARAVAASDVLIIIGR